MGEAAQAIELVMQDGEHGTKILQALNNDVPINISNVVIEELPELVQCSDDDEMDYRPKSNHHHRHRIVDQCPIQ